MKKHQVKAAKIAVLGYSAAMAVAGSMISMDAVAGCTAGSATAPVHCEFATGASAPFTDDWSFTGSNKVVIDPAVNATGFGACAYNIDGIKSFGLSLLGGSMTIRDVTGKAGDITSGCAA